MLPFSLVGDLFFLPQQYDMNHKERQADVEETQLADPSTQTGTQRRESQEQTASTHLTGSPFQETEHSPS